jgi:hypothetical protein
MSYQILDPNSGKFKCNLIKILYFLNCHVLKFWEMCHTSDSSAKVLGIKINFEKTSFKLMCLWKIMSGW